MEKKVKNLLHFVCWCWWWCEFFWCLTLLQKSQWMIRVELSDCWGKTMSVLIVCFLFHKHYATTYSYDFMCIFIINIFLGSGLTFESLLYYLWRRGYKSMLYAWNLGKLALNLMINWVSQVILIFFIFIAFLPSFRFMVNYPFVSNRYSL